MRVLSLLEVWLKKQPRSPLSPLCALPMLRALRAACRPSGHAPLAKRLAAVLTHQLAACRPALPADLAVPLLDASVSTEAAEAHGALAATLNKVLYFATRKGSPEVNTAATKVYGTLLRAVADAQGRGSAAAAELLRAQCAACVADTLRKRKTCWSHVALAALVKGAPAATGHILQGALKFTGSQARTEFVRIEALQTCAACLRCEWGIGMSTVLDGVRMQRRRVHVKLPLLVHEGKPATRFACCRSSVADKEALRALQVDSVVAEAVANVASGGFSSGVRWAEALSAAAGALQGLHDVHRKRALREIVPQKHLQLQTAVKHGLSADDLPAKCATQLNRMRVLLDAEGPDASAEAKGEGRRAGGGSSSGVDSAAAVKRTRSVAQEEPANGRSADGAVRVSVQAAGSKRRAEKDRGAGGVVSRQQQAKRKGSAADKKDKVKRRQKPASS